jgi:hypothetical protein
MRRSFTVGAFAVAVLVVAGAYADDPLKSGPDVGKNVPAFHPLNVNGKGAGKKVCQV